MAVAIGMYGRRSDVVRHGIDHRHDPRIDLQNVGESRELLLEQTEIERPTESRVARVRAVLGRIRSR